MRSLRKLSAAWVALFCLHCAGEAPPDAVAVWAEGAVTAADVERRILELPPASRRPEDGDFATWYEQLARELVLEEILARGARESGLAEDPATQRALDELVKEALAEAYLERHLPALPPVGEDDILALYEQRRDSFMRPAQRAVLHIFLRRSAGKGSEQLRSELASLRQRVLEGESIKLLAREHSQSETRHRDGFMGTFRRGQLAPELERLVFDLPVKTPSEPVLTPQGGHIFFIEMAIDERRFEIADVQRQLAEEIRQQRRDEAIDALSTDYQVPEGSFVPTDEDLGVVVRSGDPRSLVLRLGDFELRFGELLERLADEPPGEGTLMDRARRLTHWLVRRQGLVHAARAHGYDQESLLAARLRSLQDVELARLQAKNRMLERVTEGEQPLRAYYDSNRMRYSEPLRLRLVRLRVPIEDPQLAVQRMARLEDAVSGSPVGGLDLESLAGELGGATEEVGWTSLEVLRQQQPRVADLVAPLTVGEVTPPFRTAQTLELLKVSDRREPSALPFEKVREQVAEDYLDNHGRKVYAEMSETLLHANDYRPLPDRLVAMVSQVTPGPDLGAGDAGSPVSTRR